MAQPSTSGRSANDLELYLLRDDSIMPIWIRDIQDTIAPAKVPAAGMEYWYIGTVPCRQFRIVALILSSEPWENDSSFGWTYSTTGLVRWSFADPSPARAMTQPSNPSRVSFDQMIPKWNIARFIIKVQLYKSKRRQPSIVKEERIVSVQVELDHWNEVMQHHATTYREPFVVPEAPVVRSPQRPPVNTRIESAPTSTSKLGEKTDDRIGNPPPSASLPAPLPPPPLPSPHFTPAMLTVSPGEARLPHPSLLKSGDLTLQTFCRYVSDFMLRDKLADGTTTPSFLKSSPKLNISRDFKATVGGLLAPSIPYSFSLEYLERVPDLRYLARRIILRLERSLMKDYLRKRKEQRRNGDRSKASDLEKPPVLTSERLMKRIQDLFDEAILGLSHQGDLLIYTYPDLRDAGGAGRPMSEAMLAIASSLSKESPHQYPESLGPWRVWEAPGPYEPPNSLLETQNLSTMDVSASRISTLSSTTRSPSSKQKRPIPGLEDWDGPIDGVVPLTRAVIGVEAYILTTPEVLAPVVTSHLESLRQTAKSKVPPRYAKLPGGGTAEMIYHSMLNGRRGDDVWRRITVLRIEEVLKHLDDKRVVRKLEADWWSFA